MDDPIDYSTATSEQMAAAFGRQLRAIRIARNITQRQLASDAGVTLTTINRLEAGQNVSLDTFIRVLLALDLRDHIANLLPNPSIRPIERLETGRNERQRARRKSSSRNTKWTWGDEP